MGGAVLAGIIFIGLGLLFLFGRDFMWGLTEWSNSSRGLTSERTDAWDTQQTIGGVVSLVIGIGAIILVISSSVNQSQANAAATQTAQNTVTDLNTKFSKWIMQWEGVSDANAHTPSPSEVGIDADKIYFGRCTADSDNFYIFVINYPSSGSQSYAYTPDTSPNYCKPDGVDVSDSASIGKSWYSITTFGTSEFTIPLPTFTTDTPEPDTVTQSPSPTPNPTDLQQTLDAAIQQQVATAMAQPGSAMTQTIAAAVQGTLTAMLRPTATPTP